MAYVTSNRYLLTATITTEAGHGVALVSITDALRKAGLRVETATLRGSADD